MRTMRTAPPTNSASVKRQPSRTHSTSPSSQTRFVEANWNASADAADAPFWKRDFAIAIAAYEQDDEAAPSAVARATGAKPLPERARSMRARGTQACTTADTPKPKTSAHHTSYAIRPAFSIPSTTNISGSSRNDGPLPAAFPSSRQRLARLPR